MVDIQTKVKQLIHKFRSNNPFEIAKSKNIFVLFEPLGSTLGFYNAHKRIQFIHINNEIGETLQRFVCAHELGHAILHPKTNTSFLKQNTFFSLDRLEVEANTFAVALLLSDKDLKNYETKEFILRENGIPYEMERFI